MKLFLLDAYALIYRSYYALIKMPRITSKGLNTSAIFGFVNTLEEVLKKENPTHIGVAFDPPGPTFRHEAYEAYKAQREETPEVIRQSVPIIKDIISAYNIPILEIPYYEADDVIGTLASKAPADCKVYMMTPDKDFGQLVNEHVFIYKPAYKGNEFNVLGVNEVKDRYGLNDPSQIIDLLALMGDKSDNIPGCPGVGEVIAGKLIAQFGSVENLLENTNQLTGSLKTKIEENKETILFSKFLATIKTDVPVDFDLNSLIRQKINEPVLRKKFDELEFRQLSARVFGESRPAPTVVSSNRQPVQTSLFDTPSEETTEAVFNSTQETIKTTPHRYSLLESSREIIDFIDKIKEKKQVSFDTETTGVDPLSAELVGMSFALQEGEAFFVSIPENFDEAGEKAGLFKEILENPDILKIGQNIKFDINVIKKYGIHTKGQIFDTLVAHYLLNPEYRHNLNYLAETYLNYRMIPIEELIGAKGKNQLNMRQVPLDALVDYACEDAEITLKLKSIFKEKIEKNNLAKLLYEVELPLVEVLADMEEAGVRLDTSALKQSSIELTQYLREIEQAVHALAGIEIGRASCRERVFQPV
jgi:DNA polymerase-1